MRRIAVLGFASAGWRSPCAGRRPRRSASRWPPTSPSRPRRLARRSRPRPATTVVLSFGATGALYTQITQGAPFEVFLSADDKRPAQAVTEGFGVEGTVFTYAIGKVVLYSARRSMSPMARRC